MWLAAIPAIAGGIASIAQAAKSGSSGGTPGSVANPYTPHMELPQWTQRQKESATPSYDTATGKKISSLEQMGESGLANPYVATARGQQDEMRQRYMDALGMVQERAQGKNSVVEAQAQVERDRAQRAFASQLASMSGQGYYNPAAAFQAQQQSSGIQQQMAGQVAAAKAQEMQNAQSAYLQAIGAGRQQDLGLMSQELEQERQRQQFYAGMAGLGQSYAAMEMQNRLAQQQMAADLEKATADIRLRAGLGGAALQQQQAQQQQNFWGNLGTGFAGMGSGLLQAYAMNNQNKQSSSSSSSASTGGGNDPISPWWK